MWKAFYANVRGRNWRRLGMRRRLVLLSRSVRGIVQYCTGVWPPQHKYCEKLNVLQRKMVSMAMDNTRLSIESWVDYVRRSARTASSWIERHSLWWSREWLLRSVTWNDHLRRDLERQLACNCSDVRSSTSYSWASILFSWHASEWLSAQRVYFNRSRSGGSLSSRTGTRSLHGFVHIRWHEGVEYAQRMTL